MYFALHNDNIRAVLNRMKVNTVHVWQDSRDEMCKFSGQEAVWVVLLQQWGSVSQLQGKDAS